MYPSFFILPFIYLFCRGVVFVVIAVGDEKIEKFEGLSTKTKMLAYIICDRTVHRENYKKKKK